MIVRGDVEQVNLQTGERRRRVVGNGESWLESLGIPGLRIVNPEELAEYEQAMKQAIPEMIDEVRKRIVLAHDARNSVIF